MTKVCVLGAAGGIGQPLSLLLKQSPLVSELALYDVVNALGVAADLSHISSPASVHGYLPNNDGLQTALQGANVVIVPAGIPRKPGMTRDDLFKINAGIVRDLVTSIALNCPKACILIISNPVNSTVPIAAEVLKKHNVFDATKLFGVTTLDIIRAQTFVAQLSKAAGPRKFLVPVVGGHSGETIVPLLSLTKPSTSLSTKQVEQLTQRIQFGGDEVVKAKDGAGSATLSMAHAGFRFAEAILRALRGEEGIRENAMVFLPGIAGGDTVFQQVENTEFFAVSVELGTAGAKNVAAFGPISDFENNLLKTAIHGLQTSIKKGVDFVQVPAK